ncbi:hypothetical protein [Methylobacterium sp. 391_Methyba4]|uniref:hypothetical protein n=1 Tax=Methylobacterium sp. 391_Methyba4 TaxID=3038924 RepID=UPI00241F5D1D|nr:hypothetical protein [Methylobacterium sp. 391_Methyba4]WFS06253.1 hypothetical protein P9K36_23050 [Methylobacterium sp. 391_Methyba4]
MTVSLAEKEAFVLAVIADSTLTPTARFVATVLAIRFLNRKTLRCDPAFETISQAVGSKRRMTILAVEELEKAGWLKVERRGGRHRPNMFELCFDRAGNGTESGPLSGERVHPSAPLTDETVQSSAPFGGEKVHHSAPFRAERVHPIAPEPTVPPGRGERVPTRGPGGPGFEAFWQAYPKRSGRLKAEKIFEHLVATGRASESQLISAAQRYTAERAGEDPKYHRNPSNWLGDGDWLNEPAPARAPAAQGSNQRTGSFSFMDYARQTQGRSRS